jgi:Fe-S cluster assembly ATP-binding protein
LGITLAHQRPPTLAGVTLRHLLASILDHEAEGMHQSERLATALHLQSLLDRNINAGLSGGEIKRSELFQMLAMRRRFALLDEPDSGIDLESLALVGQMVSAVVTPADDCPDLRSALLVTHTGHILDYVKVDQAHIMVEGQLVCSGEPTGLIQAIQRHGFQACTRLTAETDKTERRRTQHANDLAGAK